MLRSNSLCYSTIHCPNKKSKLLAKGPGILCNTQCVCMPFIVTKSLHYCGIEKKVHAIFFWLHINNNKINQRLSQYTAIKGGKGK